MPRKPSEIFQQLKAEGKGKDIPHWESRWPESILRRRAADLGSKAFARGYFMEALSDEDLTFPNFNRVVVPGLDESVWAGHEGWRAFGGVDISSPERPGCVIATVKVSPDGRRYPMAPIYGGWKSPEFVRRIIGEYEKHRHDVIFVENNAVQVMLEDWLAEKAPYIPVQGFHTGKQKFDPILGLPALDVEFEKDMWVVPGSVVEGHGIDCSRGPKGGKCPWCRFVYEFSGHPGAESTDLVMAYYFCRDAIRQYWNTGFVIEQEPSAEGDFGLVDFGGGDDYDFT